MQNYFQAIVNGWLEVSCYSIVCHSVSETQKQFSESTSLPANAI